MLLSKQEISPEQCLAVERAMKQPLPDELLDFEVELADFFRESACQWLLLGRQKDATVPLMLDWSCGGGRVTEDEVRTYSRQLKINLYVIFRQQLVKE